MAQSRTPGEPRERHPRRQRSSTPHATASAASRVGSSTWHSLWSLPSSSVGSSTNIRNHRGYGHIDSRKGRCDASPIHPRRVRGPGFPCCLPRMDPLYTRQRRSPHDLLDRTIVHVPSPRAGGCRPRGRVVPRGLRRSEAAALTWRDVTEATTDDSLLLTIRQSKTKSTNPRRRGAGGTTPEFRSRPRLTTHSGRVGLAAAGSQPRQDAHRASAKTRYCEAPCAPTGHPLRLRHV